MNITVFAILLLINYIGIRLFLNLLTNCLEVYRFLHRGMCIFGIVLHWNTKEDIDQYTQYAAVVEYVADDGNSYTIDSNDYNYSSPKIGTKVIVCYDKSNPSDAIIDPAKVIALKIVGMLLVVVVVVVLNVVLLQ